MGIDPIRIDAFLLKKRTGLSVPGLYGPAKEDWAEMGMEAPKM